MKKARMKKTQVVKLFNEYFEEFLLENEDRRGDKPLKRTAWNNFTDTLCKEQLITLHQLETWKNPFN